MIEPGEVIPLGDEALVRRMVKAVDELQSAIDSAVTSGLSVEPSIQEISQPLAGAGRAVKTYRIRVGVSRRLL